MLPGLLAAVLTAALAAPVIEDGGELKPPDLDSCLGKPAKCWRLVEKTFPSIFDAHLGEVEAAMPGRFLQDAVTFAKRTVDIDGHYLEVQCVRQGGVRTSCPALRDSLEERVGNAALLQCFPRPMKPWVDEDTWRLTAEGKKALEKLRKAYPDLKGKLAKLIERALGRDAGGIKVSTGAKVPAQPPESPGPLLREFEPQPSDKPVPLLR